jgi:TatA/E family protein of Tat protein translocase
MSARELLILVVIGLLLVGASRLPALARAIGESIAEFQRARRLMPPAPIPFRVGLVVWFLVGVVAVLVFGVGR